MHSKFNNFRDELISNCLKFKDENRPCFVEIHKFLKKHYTDLNDENIKPSKLRVELKLSLLQMFLMNIKKYKWILLIGLLFFLLALFGLLYFEPFILNKPVELTTTLSSTQTKNSRPTDTTESPVLTSIHQKNATEASNIGPISTSTSPSSTQKSSTIDRISITSAFPEIINQSQWTTSTFKGSLGINLQEIYLNNII